MNLTILDIEYTLSYESPGDWNLNGLGRSSMHNGQIAIRDDAPRDIKHSTILHEVIHQISDILDLGLSADENIISGVSAGVFSFIKNNPEIIKEMLNKEG